MNLGQELFLYATVMLIFLYKIKILAPISYIKCYLSEKLLIMQYYFIYFNLHVLIEDVRLSESEKSANPNDLKAIVNNKRFIS